MTNRTNPFTRMDLIQPFIDYSNSVPDVGLEPSHQGTGEDPRQPDQWLRPVPRDAHRGSPPAGRDRDAHLPARCLARGARTSPPRERAAIAWTEALTKLSHDTDAAYALIEAEFTEAERVALTLLIGNINTWNRINVGFQVKPPRSSAIAVAA